jgi:hypothetical protein
MYTEPISLTGAKEGETTTQHHSEICPAREYLHIVYVNVSTPQPRLSFPRVCDIQELEQGLRPILILYIGTQTYRLILYISVHRSRLILYISTHRPGLILYIGTQTYTDTVYQHTDLQADAVYIGAQT